MATKKKKTAPRNGKKAFNTILKQPPAAPAKVVPDAGEAVGLGIQGREGFVPMDRLAILSVSRDFRRRFATVGDMVARDAVYSLRTIMWCRLKIDFPDCQPTMHVLQPRGDLGVIVDGTAHDEYLNDPRVLQERFDKACAMWAECLGV